MVEPEAVQRARVQLGRQLAVYRKATGYGQEQLASLVFVSRSTIANVETGRQRVPRAFWEQCDVVLTTGGLLTVGYDELRRIDRQLGVEAATQISIGGLNQGVPRPSSDEAATAHDALPLTNLITALTAHHLTGVQRQEPTNHPLFEGGSLRTSAELLLKSFLKLDDEQGGDALYLPLSRFVAEMSQAADERPDGNLGVFGQLSQMTGWLALDANRHGAARRYLTTAVYAAHEADEPSLAASALAYMSLQDTYRGRITSALSLARTAFEVSDGSVTPLTMTMLATRLARAHAAAGNQTASLHALHKASTAFDRPRCEPEPLWISYVDDIELAAQEGACYLELRMARQARSSLQRAIRLLATKAPHRRRDRVHYLSRLAKCYLLEYDVEAACHTATQALDLATTIGSARVTERLREFRDALQPFGKNKAAGEFQARFVTSTVSQLRRPGGPTDL